MGLKAIVTKLLSFTRVTRNGVNISDVKVDPGGGANITGEHYATPGDDSFPVNGDYPFFVPINRSGVFAAIGYIDAKNVPKAQLGEKRIYGRDADGNEINEVWLKADGTILVSNGTGSVEIKADGEIETINGGGSITLKPSGELTCSASTEISFTAPAIKVNGALEVSDGITNTGGTITSSGITLDLHKHVILGGSSAPGPTDVPI